MLRVYTESEELNAVVDSLYFCFKLAQVLGGLFNFAIIKLCFDLVEGGQYL